MGRHRRLREKQEADALRKKRMGRLGAFLLIAAVAVVTAWLLVPKDKGPAGEEDRLIRLAADRGVFVFGSHLDAQDFALVEPFMEETFREAQKQGRKVLFVDELGSMGVPRDSASGQTPYPEVWLAEIQRDPARCRAEYMGRMAIQRASKQTILHGQYWAPGSYDGTFGQFKKALHAFLIRHLDVLADMDVEDLSWEDYCEDLRLQGVERKAYQAYMGGDPDGYERLAWEAYNGREVQQLSRDRNLLLQMGRRLKDRDDLVAVTTRGTGHWGMVRLHDIRQANKPEWEKFFEDGYGMARIDMHRLMGKPLSAEEERHWMLAQCPGLMLQSYLIHHGLCKTPREASLKVKAILEDPAITVERLRELSTAMAHARITDEEDACVFVYSWSRSNGFLR